MERYRYKPNKLQLIIPVIVFIFGGCAAEPMQTTTSSPVPASKSITQCVELFSKTDYECGPDLIHVSYNNDKSITVNDLSAQTSASVDYSDTPVISNVGTTNSHCSINFVEYKGELRRIYPDCAVSQQKAA